MSEQLERELRLLEQDYADMPPAVRRVDLPKINELRAQLGLSRVDDRLRPLEPDPAPAATVAPEPEPDVEPVPDHAEARAIYAEYTRRTEELAVYRSYCDRVAKATAGAGQTPVRPLATMGTDGGPLLCDHCGKPMVLEGGTFHDVHADVAWRQARSRGNWTSYILGGMVVERQTNGTLRIYHGYPGRGSGCCNVAGREDDEARRTFDDRALHANRPIVRAFVEHEFSDLSPRERGRLVADVLEVVFGYDPGLGVNRPPKT